MNLQFDKSAPLATRTLGLALLCLATLALGAPADGQAVGLDERRQTGSAEEVWSSAMALIRVPVSRYREGHMRHFTEHCTAIAVTPGPRALYLSAWHCFDGYSHTLGQIEMVLRGQAMSMTLLSSGGSMAEDWAILRATDTDYVPPTWVPVLGEQLSARQSLMAAGFGTPPDTENASAARRLLFDPDCTLAESEGRPHATNCVARKGSSGGAILARTASGSPRLAGIISAGDGSHLSFFYPASVLSNRLRVLR